MDKRSLLSAAELEALMQTWGAYSGTASADRFFPLRFWFLFAVTVTIAVALLFHSQAIASDLTKDHSNVLRLSTFLYFRGWFMLVVLTIGTYSYLKAWYPAMIWSALLLTGTVNLITDLFLIYPERLENPQPQFTTLLLVRIYLLWLMFVNVRNAGRLPEAGKRTDIFLPFRTRL